MRNLGLAALTGVLWVLASPPYGLWPLGWIAMVPVLWLIERAPTARTAGRHGWIAGTVTTAGGFSWIAPMLQQHAQVPWPLAILALLAFAAYQGLGLLLAGRAIWWIRRRTKLPLALVAAVAVVAVEKAFPVEFDYSVSISQAPALPLIQISDLFGAACVTALLIAAAGAIVERRGNVVVAGLVAASAVYGLIRIDQIDDRRARARHVKVGLVQPNEAMHLGANDPRHDRALLEQMQAESARLERDGAALLVWSETSYPILLPHDLDRDLTGGWRVRQGFDAPIVFGAPTVERAGKRRMFNSAILLVGDDVRGMQSKVHRVLGSEYNPIGEHTGWMPVGFSGGDGPAILEVDGLRLGVLICLEDTLGPYAREVAAARPNLLVNLTIDTWFGTFAEPFQHRALAQFRAIEQRADLVRSVNTGPSGLVTATGALGPQTATRGGEHVPVEGVIVDAAVMEAGHTLYGTIGDAFAWLCVALTLAGWIWSRRQRVPASIE